MKFSREQINSLSIRKIERGAITIGEHIYSGNIGLTPAEIIDDWPLCRLDELTEINIQPILELAPEMIIIGTGWKNAFAPRDLVFALARRGIGLEVMDTPAACRTFNIVAGEDRTPGAILFI